MAKDLSSQTGVQTDTDYLNGKLVDGQTLVGEGINQDIVQFFQKLMDLAGLTANGNYENEANTYQFISALNDRISTLADAAIEDDKEETVDIIEIGDWDMDTNATKTVPHTFGSEYKQVRSIDVIIRNDGDTTYTPLNTMNSTDDVNGGVDGFNSTDITLRRKASGVFDSSLFSATSYNRGWVRVVKEKLAL